MDKAVLIDKVLIGIASEVEKQELQEWMDADPVNKAEFEIIKAYQESVDAFYEKEGDELSCEGYWEFNERLQKVRRKKRMVRSVIRYATSLVVSIIIVLSIPFYMGWPPFARQSNTLVLMEDTFYDNSYGNIFRSIQDRYGIVIDTSFTDNPDCHFTGGFSRGYEIDKLILQLASSSGLQASKDVSGHFVLSGIPCANK